MFSLCVRPRVLCVSRLEELESLESLSRGRGRRVHALALLLDLLQQVLEAEALEVLRRVQVQLLEVLQAPLQVLEVEVLEVALALSPLLEAQPLLQEQLQELEEQLDDPEVRSRGP